MFFFSRNANNKPWQWCTGKKFGKITILNVFERSLLCSSGLDLAYLNKNTEKKKTIL